MAIDLLKLTIAELQVTVDHQFTIEHYHRWKDGSVKLSRLRRIRRSYWELEPDAEPPPLTYEKNKRENRFHAKAN